MFEILPMTAAFERLFNNNTLTVRKSQFRMYSKLNFPSSSEGGYLSLLSHFDCCVLITVYNGMSIETICFNLLAFHIITIKKVRMSYWQQPGQS